jgi:hypothetical protein
VWRSSAWLVAPQQGRFTKLKLSCHQINIGAILTPIKRLQNKGAFRIDLNRVAIDLNGDFLSEAAEIERSREDRLLTADAVNSPRAFLDQAAERV